jgi:glyoxylate/hydroxypyruvate reductase
VSAGGRSRAVAEVVLLGGDETWRLALEHEVGEPVALPEELASFDTARVAIVVGSSGPPLAAFCRLELAVSLLAGVDRLLDPPVPGDLTIVRACDPGLERNLVESVLLHVLGAHRGAIDYRGAQRRHEWLERPQPSAAERPVGFLGLGSLGAAAAQSIAARGFPVSGWSRGPHELPGIRCLRGIEALAEVLAGSEILVCLLPLTDATRGLLDRGRLARMRAGATLINLGRGGIVDEAALLELLDRGHLGGAILDVFEEEPLPRTSPLWDHERVVVYPHAAGDAVPASGAEVAAAAVRRYRAGERPLHQVDAAAGY